jgi:Cu/Ag efflux protein CusF
MEARQMKRFGSILSTILIAALVITIPVAAFAAGKTHDMKAEVVSVDEKTKMITIKDDKGESHTAPLLGAAIGEAKSLKPGDKVTLTCQDNDKGEHQGVKAIKKG